MPGTPGRPRRPTVLACVSAAAARGLAVLVEAPIPHVWIPPHAGGAVPRAVHVHRSRPLVPAAGGLVSVADMLVHVAMCLPSLEALVVWEAALHARLVSRPQLARIRWPGPVTRELARIASDQSESVLETLTLHRLRALGVAVRQQVPIGGHRVDFLLGTTVVVQVDGFGFHTAAQRRSDIEHDARLALEGYRVLRFDYGDVVERWSHVEALILATLAQSA